MGHKPAKVRGPHPLEREGGLGTEAMTTSLGLSDWYPQCQNSLSPVASERASLRPDWEAGSAEQRTLP